MVSTYYELKLSGQTPGATENYENFIPPAGTKVSIEAFAGSAAFNPNSCCKLIWKFGTPGETILWTISGDSPMPLVINLPAAEVNGINVLAISVQNVGITPVFLSAFARIGVGIG